MLQDIRTTSVELRHIEVGEHSMCSFGPCDRSDSARCLAAGRVTAPSIATFREMRDRVVMTSNALLTHLTILHSDG